MVSRIARAFRVLPHVVADSESWEMTFDLICANHLDGLTAQRLQRMPKGTMPVVDVGGDGL